MYWLNVMFKTVKPVMRGDSLMALVLNGRSLLPRHFSVQSSQVLLLISTCLLGHSSQLCCPVACNRGKCTAD